MSASQFGELRAFIHAQTGIWFADNKTYLLEARLGRRLVELGIDDWDAYLQLLGSGTHREEELHELFSQIAVHETSFFRNAKQLDVFSSDILPEIVRRRRDARALRIWSAGCATGEEAYTIAMLVAEALGSELCAWSVEVLGTDLSARALRAAETGRYPSLALRTVDAERVRRWFQECNGFHQVEREIRGMVTFRRANLMDGLPPGSDASWDAIFCRNVLCYFDPDTRERCLQHLARALVPGGTLLVGHNESFRNNAIFLARPEPHGFAYSRVRLPEEGMLDAA